tara:strand:+ start:3281 stop:4669 length:1389 start_codon:yes stop_codon:yes gene_type:complete
MIQNYDTNGLVFALRPEWVGLDFDSETYKKAILNILDAQKFDCIPLVDKPVIRENTNNLMDRAVYKKGQGRITHIARKARYQNEEPLMFIPINEITHIESDVDLIDAVIELFSFKNDEVCNFIISIGGTPELPVALFTFRELLLEKTRNELFLRMAKSGIGNEDSNLTTISYLIYTELSEINEKQDWDEVKKALDKVIPELKKVPKSINNHNIRKSGLIDSGDFSNLKVKDIMTNAACGLEVNVEEKFWKDARTLLCKANDFDRLVVYNNGKLNPKMVIAKNGKLTDSITAKTEDSVRSVIKRFNKTKSKDIYAIIEPNDKIITGEGPMVWPGFLTIQELRSPKALLSYAATCGMIEFRMKKYMKAHGIDKIPVRKRVEVIEKATVGQIVGFLRNGNYFNEIFDVFRNQITIDELGNFVDIRNNIVHESLIACFGHKINPEKISILNLQLVYKIAECLKIFD